MTFEEWEQGVPREFKGDSLWKVRAYRLSLYCADLAWGDVTALARQPLMRPVADQLYRAVGSIGANLAEGYSRGSGRDRVRFYEYALGSARESRDWYYKARHVLHSDILRDRLALLTEILRLLLTMIPDQRQHSIRESDELYSGNSEE